MTVKLMKSAVVAREIGADDGRRAAGWVFDGSTSADLYRVVRDGLDDGDPTILDMLPVPNLSGEWADGYTPRELMADTDADDAEYETVCDAYADGFRDAVHAEVQRIIAIHV